MTAIDVYNKIREAHLNLYIMNLPVRVLSQFLWEKNTKFIWIAFVISMWILYFLNIYDFDPYPCNIFLL